MSVIDTIAIRNLINATNKQNGTANKDSTQKTTCKKHSSVKRLFIVRDTKLYFCAECGDELKAMRVEQQRLFLQKQEVDKEMAAAEAKGEERRQKEQKLKLAGIERRFWGETFETFQVNNSEQKKVCAFLRRHANEFDPKSGISYTLIGSVGTGKTHLAQALVKQLVKSGFDCKYYTVSHLFREIRSCYSPKAVKTEVELFNYLKNLDYLVIDEIGGKTKISEDELNNLSSVIDDRYMAQKATMLISNLMPEEIGELLGDRIKDRLFQVNQYLVLAWDSYRNDPNRELIL